MKRFLRHFLKVNRVQLLILPVVLILAFLSGTIYFRFDKIISPKAKVAIKGTKVFKNEPKKEEANKGEAPASSPPAPTGQKKEEGKAKVPLKSAKNEETSPSSPPSPLSTGAGGLLSQNQPETIKVELSIDHGVKKTYFVEVAKGSTVYDLLKQASSQYGFSLDASFDPAYGAFIEEIDGVRNNPQEGKYWLYYLNDKLANLGASSQKLSLSGKVLWKYEKSH